MTLQYAAQLSQLFYIFLNDTALPEQAVKACLIAMYHIDENLARAQENSKHQQHRAIYTRLYNDERAARFEQRYGEKLETGRMPQK